MKILKSNADYDISKLLHRIGVYEECGYNCCSLISENESYIVQ
jgi:hypothetical protein